MKFSIIGDLHGSTIYLRYLKRKLSKTDAIFITGDIAGTLSYRLILKSIIQSRKISREKYAELVYGKYLTKFAKFQKKTANKILKILSKTKIPIYFTHGNSDSEAVLEFFREYSENSNMFHYLGNSTVKHSNLIIAGYGYCSPAEYRTPFQTPGEKDTEEIIQDLSNIEEEIKKYSRDDDFIKVGLFHEPPFNTNLDYISYKSSHGGSKEISNHIRNSNYQYVISGHIHESPSYMISKESIMINPGSLVNRRWAELKHLERSVKLKRLKIPSSVKGFIYNSRPYVE